MGTRHLICVAHEGKYKVAQYGQWDGYPSGQGVAVLAFLSDQFNREVFLARLAETHEPSTDLIDRINSSIDAGGRISDIAPSLSRDMSSDILALIQDSTSGVPLRLSPDFAADSLFCEWAYVIDLDKNTFEVFKGFNEQPLAEGDRFYRVTCDGAAKGYHPVKFVAGWPLGALPPESAFLDKLEPQDEEEAA